MPSSRELRSRVSRRPAPCRATTTSPFAQTSGPAAKSSFAVEIVERARAVEGEPGRRQAGKIDEMGEDAAGRLVGIDAERELVGGGHIGHQRLELARRVEPSRGQREIEPLGRRPQRRLAVDVEARRDADDRLAERQLLDGELLDDHLDRQFGQDRLGRGVVRRRRGVCGRKRAPQKLHVPDRELVDLQPAAEQRKPAPDQPDLVDLQPRARRGRRGRCR